MARRRVDHRGIRFGIVVSASGYAWQAVPGLVTHDGRDIVALAPVGYWQSGGPAWPIMFRGTRAVKQMVGLDIARKAFNRFRRLAETITRWEVMEDEPVVDHAGNTVLVTGIKKMTADPDECRRLIVEYANEFGALWGDDDHRELDDWLREAAHFLALLDIAQALRLGADTTAFDECVIEGQPQGVPITVGAPRRELQYISKRPIVPIMRIAHIWERSESRRALNAVTQTTDHHNLAASGGSRLRARMLLNRQVNNKLAGGLSFHAGWLEDRHAVVVPHHLVHLLYLRLWIDTVDSEDLERQRTCLTCGRELVGTARKTYCDDACRSEYHNRRRARSG